MISYKEQIEMKKNKQTANVSLLFQRFGHLNNTWLQTVLHIGQTPPQKTLTFLHYIQLLFL